MPIGALTNPALAEQLTGVLVKQFGLHPGYRPVHAKGLMCSGVFTPSPEAAKLTRAPHASRPSTPVTVRFSNSTGLPNIPDNDPAQSGPRGMAIRFHLSEHDHTDIIAHSTNGFPVHTSKEFLQLVEAAIAFGAGQPEALVSFLMSHPNAKRFVETPKPIPSSFAREAFFAVTSFKFTNANGLSRHGRFRIRPAAGTEYFSDKEAAAKSKDFLFDEIGPRLAKEPAEFEVFAQMAERGDDVTDASVTWPETRAEIPFGTITLTARVDDQEPARRKIIFDPLPRVDGIDSSGDPLTDVRADAYLLSGRRRRAASNESNVAPRHEQIERRAYELYLGRGREEGKALDDWLTAEAELTRESSETAAEQGRAAAVGGTPT
jgi:catalase